jgi:hypothetical protein
MRPMIGRADRHAALTGALAGAAASTVQSAIGFTIDKLLLPPEHDNNISPRLVDRATSKLGIRTPRAFNWVAGVTFHFAYGIGWGTVFGLLDRHFRLPRPLLGTLLGGTIYTLAFSRIGLGTKTDTEIHPDERPLAKQLDLMAVAFAYALSLAFLYGPIERRLQRSRAAEQPVDSAAEGAGQPAQPFAGLR